MVWWSGGRELYGQYFSQAANAIYGLVGIDPFPALHRQRYINYVPFIALMALTPGLDLRRRSLRLLAGIFAIFVSHVVVNALGPRQGPDFTLPVSLAVFCDAFPFVLWAILAREFAMEWTLRFLGMTPDSDPPAAS